jgi:hypothetical protein
VQGDDDIFAATMPLPKSCVRLGSISMKKKVCFENKVRFEKNLAPKLKSIAFKTKLSQGF